MNTEKRIKPKPIIINVQSIQEVPTLLNDKTFIYTNMFDYLEYFLMYCNDDDNNKLLFIRYVLDTDNDNIECDPVASIFIENDSLIELLYEMMTFFIEHEMYEKCTRLKSLFDFINEIYIPANLTK